jgi:hypothetical protein
MVCASPSGKKKKLETTQKRKLKTAHNEQRRLGRLTSNSALPAGDDGEESGSIYSV